MKNGGCGCGCGGGCGRNRSGGQNDCQQLGPFTAIDRACIVPPAITGSIIPFSSGLTPVVLGVVAGVLSLPSQIGFGTATPGVAVVGNTIDLSTLVSEEFNVPRAGNITAISASFKETLGLTLIGTATINARIYKASGNTSLFTATDASVDLVTTGPISIGQVLSNSANITPVPVAKGDRLVMIFSITLPTGLVVVFTGTASAGITIA